MANGKKPVILPDYANDPERAAVQAFNEQFFQQLDTSALPGYSEFVKANDIAAADDFVWQEQNLKTGLKKETVYQTIGAHPRELIHEFMWLRVADVNGQQSAQVSSELMEYRRRGWRVATEDDLTNDGIGFPPAGYKAADGGIRRDDLQLYVVDGRAARAYRKALADYTHNLENTTTASVDAADFAFETERRSEILTI